MIHRLFLLLDRPAWRSGVTPTQGYSDLDVLSDVLRAVRLTGAVYFDVHARQPWVAETPPTARIGGKVMPGFEHVIAFHIMLDGWCWAQVADESTPPIRLESGDAVLFLRGDPHFMSTERGQRSSPMMDIYYRPTDRPLPFVLNELGGQGDKSRFVCGYLGFDSRPFNPMLGALPSILHVKGSSVGGQLTHDLIRVALKESANPSAGGETILSKLSEVMFLQAIREHIDSLPAESTGWLAALRDRQIGTALGLMHGRPAEPWTLDSLAREIGLSRSAFADRFNQVMGSSVMHYLSNWRLQLAANLLEQKRLSIAQAAAQVGYESEAAFNRAFKKMAGVPPGAWRRSRPAAALLLTLATPSCVSTSGKLDTSGMSFSFDPLVGKIIWSDLVTEDLDGAKRFYGKLFGWTFQDTTSYSGQPYALAKSGNVYVAGLLSVPPRRDGQKVSRWVPYVSVPDVDAALDRVREAKGGIPVPARDVRIGRVAAIVDPEGAVIGLVRSKIGDPDDATTKAAWGRIVWTELLSNNPTAAADFYRSVMGYEPRTIERRGGQYTLLTRQGIERAGILKNPTENWSPDWLTYIGVADPADAAKSVEALGGRILVPVSPQIREGAIAVVADPAGAVLVLQKI